MKNRILPLLFHLLLFLIPSAAFAAADLGIKNIPDTDFTLIGDEINYAVIITNDGPDIATDVAATITLSRFMFLDTESVDASQGSCMVLEDIICDLGAISAGETAAISYSVITSDGGEIGNTARVTASSEDSNEENNFATAIVPVQSITAVEGRDTNNGGECALSATAAADFRFSVFWIAVAPALIALLRHLAKSRPL